MLPPLPGIGDVFNIILFGEGDNLLNCCPLNNISFDDILDIGEIILGFAAVTGGGGLEFVVVATVPEGGKT